MSLRKNGVEIICLLAAAFAGLRLLFLDADPSMFKHMGDIGDEGFYAAVARNYSLYGSFRTDEYIQTAVGPLWALYGVAVYAVTGVSLYAMRLPTALFAILAVFLTYALFRKHDKLAAAVAALSLAVDHKFFIYSRNGQLELVIACLLLLVFCLIAWKRPVAAGWVFAIAVATKLTALWMGGAIALFFIALRVRGDIRTRDMLQFAASAGLGLLALATWIAVNFDILRSSFGLNYSRVEGVAFFNRPAQIFNDLVMSRALMFPSIVLSLILVAVYAQRCGLLSIAGRRWRAAIERWTIPDLLVISWFIGYLAAVLLFSDVNSRRLNLFSIPLAMVPGLLLMRRPTTDSAEGRTIWQEFLSFTPLSVLAIVVGTRLLEPLGSAAFWISTALALIGTAALAIWRSVLGVRINAMATRFSASAWVAVATLALLYFLKNILLPSLGVTDPATQIAILAAWLVFVAAFALLSRWRIAAAVAVCLTVNALLIAGEFTQSTFSMREASHRIGAVAGKEDFIIGDPPFQVCFDAQFHPFLWWPAFGVNTETAARIRPGFIVRQRGEPSSKLRTPDEVPYQYPTARDYELRAIGVREILPVLTFGLYPVRGVPREEFTLYKLVYTP